MYYSGCVGFVLVIFVIPLCSSNRDLGENVNQDLYQHVKLEGGSKLPLYGHVKLDNISFSGREGDEFLKEHGNKVHPLYKHVKSRGHSPSGWYSHAGVAADSEQCSRVGRDILEQKNGSVVDAGIAAMLCNGVVDQGHMGLGGGTIILVKARPRNGGDMETVYIAADDRAPLWVTPDTCEVDNYDWPYNVNYDDNGKLTKWNSFRNIAIGVPGELSGYFKAWQRYGKLEWKDIVEPSIKLAREGFKLTSAMDNLFTEYQPTIKSNPSLGEMFMKSKNIFYSEGETMYDSVLADTLEAIAEDPLSFYKGKLASKISDDLHDFGGKLTSEDLSSYEPRLLKPYVFPMMNGKYKVHVPPQPYGGAMMAFVNNIIESYNMTLEYISTTEGLASFYHRFTEAWKFAYGHTDCIGDDYNKYDLCNAVTSNLLSKDYASKIRRKIDDKSVLKDVTKYKLLGEDPVTSHGTSHLSIISEDGSTFMSTSSINSEFGCKKKGVRTGIIFNDRLTDFTRKRNIVMKNGMNANRLGPGKQGRSFRTPLLVTDEYDNTVLAIGSSGGSRIMMAMLQDVIFHLNYGMHLKDAIDFPRITTMPYYPDFPTLHDDFNDSILKSLKDKGQNMVPVQPSYLYTAVTQGVSLLRCKKDSSWGNKVFGKQCIEAVSDYRKGGAPHGY